MTCYIIVNPLILGETTVTMGDTVSLSTAIHLIQDHQPQCSGYLLVGRWSVMMEF